VLGFLRGGTLSAPNLGYEVIDGTLVIKSEDLDHFIQKTILKGDSDLLIKRITPETNVGIKSICHEILFPAHLKAPLRTEGVEKHIDFQQLLKELADLVLVWGDTRTLAEMQEVFPSTKQDGIRIVEVFLNSQYDKMMNIIIDELTAE